MSKLCLPPGVVEAKDTSGRSSIELAFCPTGEGGGVDPTCPSGSGGGAGKYSGEHAEALITLDGKIAAALTVRELAKANLAKAKADGDKAAITKWKKARAAANKQIDAHQKEKEKLGGKAEIKTYQKVKAGQAKIAKMPAGPTKTAAISENAKAMPVVKGDAAKAVFDAKGAVESSCCIDPEMKTSTKASNAVNAQFRKFHEELNVGEKAACLNYSGVSYANINRQLRESKGEWSNNTTEKLDKVFAKAPELEQDIVVARGTSHGSGRWEKLTTGDIFQDHGYVSTSVNSGKAFGGSTQIKIRVPKGSKGVYLNDVLSQHSHEREYLLPRGSKFRITGVEVKRKAGEIHGTRHIQMEYINE